MITSSPKPINLYVVCQPTWHLFIHTKSLFCVTHNLCEIGFAHHTSRYSAFHSSIRITLTLSLKIYPKVVSKTHLFLIKATLFRKSP